MSRNPSKHVSSEEFAAIYDTLRAIAQSQLRRERVGHTLDATAVVHEAYIRIAKSGGSNWNDRNRFLSVAAGTIRRVLVDHARGRLRQKRGAGGQRLLLHSGIEGETGPTIDVLELHDALDELEQVEPSYARIVELRFFAGLTIEEAAETMQIGRNTAVRQWRVARAWLRNHLGAGPVAGTHPTDPE